MSHSVLHSHVNWRNISELQIPWNISFWLVDFVLCFYFHFFFTWAGLFTAHITEHVWPWLEWADLRVWQVCKQFSLVNFSGFATDLKYLQQNHKTEHKSELKQSFKVQQGLNGIIKYQTLMYGCHLECIFFHRTQPPRPPECSKYSYSSGRKMPAEVHV